jgi:hypothetical protein
MLWPLPLRFFFRRLRVIPKRSRRRRPWACGIIEKQLARLDEELEATRPTAGADNRPPWCNPVMNVWLTPTPKRGPFVSLLTRFAPPSLTAEQYDEVVRRLEEEGVSPADGLDYEVAFGSGDQLKVTLVWDSQEQFEAFAARLMPILEEFGINPGEPEVFEVHNIIKR